MGALFVGGLWILIEAFKTSILWGLGSLFIPFVSLIWLVLHWDRGGKPFFIQLGGVAVMFVGLAVGG
ncbi:MAG: hypothetical protein WC423_22265 [Vulcanimicrobiota bacterium]